MILLYKYYIIIKKKMSKYYTGILPSLPVEDNSNSNSTNGNKSYNLLPFACVEGQYEKVG